MSSERSDRVENSPWLQERRRLILEWDGPVVLAASREYGPGRIARSLAVVRGQRWQAPTFSGSEQLLWIELDPKSSHSQVARAFADAINRFAEGPVVPVLAPLEQVLGVLRHHLALLDRFTLVVVVAEAALEWVEELLELHPLLRVVLCFENLNWVKISTNLNLPENTLLFTSEELRLNLQEAKTLAGGWLGEFEVAQLLERSGGALETFVHMVQSQLGTPLPMPENFPERIDPLIESGKWMKALERTCKQFPEGVPWLLDHIGPQLAVVGQWEKMSKLFSELPRKVRQSEMVLQWRLESALEQGQGPNLLHEVEAYLARHEAPDLRALYGQLKYRLGDPEGSLRETERAVKAWESVRTLYYYGFSLYAQSVVASKQVLMKALKLAEHQGALFWAAKAATILSSHSNGLGDYQAAASWGEWAVRIIDREGINNPYVRARAVNDWAFGRLMAGEIAGVEARLREAIETNKDQDAKHFLTATLADVLLVDGRALEAVTHYRHIWESQTGRNGLSARTDLFVRCLIELDQYDEAKEVAEKAVKLTEDGPLVVRRRPKLALGMVLALQAPGKAIQILEEVFGELKEPLFAWRYVQAGLYLAKAYQGLGDSLMAREVIGQLQPQLISIGATGLYYLCGPSHLFYDILGWIRGGVPRLELRLLGRPEVRLDGRLLNLGNRSLEILALLALNPHGLNLEQLAVALYGDYADKSNAKMNLYTLKKQIPVEGYPYRLGVNVWADFIEVPKQIKEGKLREAISLAKGLLLPDSEAPLVVEHRDYLNELLRHATLQNEDLEARLVLAERVQDDLELWEASLSVMPVHDPRRLAATAKIGALVANY